MSILVSPSPTATPFPIEIVSQISAPFEWSPEAVLTIVIAAIGATLGLVNFFGSIYRRLHITVVSWAFDRWNDRTQAVTLDVIFENHSQRPISITLIGIALGKGAYLFRSTPVEFSNAVHSVLFPVFLSGDAAFHGILYGRFKNEVVPEIRLNKPTKLPIRVFTTRGVIRRTLKLDSRYMSSHSGIVDENTPYSAEW